MKKVKKIKNLIVGLTGGIGSGKTEVVKIYSELGAEVLMADPIAKELVDVNTDVKNKIRKCFGSRVFNDDYTINRKRLATIVFNDNSLKNKLNRIVHPHVLEYLSKKIDKFRRNSNIPILVIEAALIFEAGAEKMFDYIIVVDAPLTKRIDRIMKRDNARRTEVISRMKAQIDSNEKVKRGDFVISNVGDIESLKKRCEFVYQVLLKLLN